MMKPLPLRLSLALLVAAGFATAEDVKPIFNGRDLTGWDGDPRLWSVRHGVIRGETSLDRMATRNTFLIWSGGKLRDFELRLKFRIQNGNSGVQYRSRILDAKKWSVGGYQAEIENKQGKVGFLYEEKGRKYLANVGEKVEINMNGERQVVGSLGDRKADFIEKGYYKEKDWNEYRIVARGNHLEHYLNGFKTIDVIDRDPKSSAEGVLALQIHAGPPMVVEFKDLLLKDL